MLQLVYGVLRAWLAFPYLLLMIAASFGWVALWWPATIAARAAGLLLYRRHQIGWRRLGAFRLTVPTAVYAIKIGDGFGCGGSGDSK